jgi:selenium metabolism protein YedF
MIIDARGLGCPKPVIMAEEALNKIEEGTIEVLVDRKAAMKNLQKFANKNGMYSEATKENNYWRVKITKGYSCAIPDGAEKSLKNKVLRLFQSLRVFSGGNETEKKEILMIISTDTLGKEEEIGRTLMKGFLETIKVTKELPDMIFFLNAGVRLTTINEETIPLLKEIEKMGVEIYSCGTCLKYYNLESELKVGYRGTTNHIVEGIKDFKKVVWV